MGLKCVQSRAWTTSSRPQKLLDHNECPTYHRTTAMKRWGRKGGQLEDIRTGYVVRNCITSCNPMRFRDMETHRDGERACACRKEDGFMPNVVFYNSKRLSNQHFGEFKREKAQGHQVVAQECGGECKSVVAEELSQWKSFKIINLGIWGFFRGMSGRFKGVFRRFFIGKGWKILRRQFYILEIYKLLKKVILEESWKNE